MIVLCLNCKGEIIKNPNNKKKKFCSSSCSATYNNKLRYYKPKLSETDNKKCNTCDITKLSIMFYKRESSPDGYRNDCIECFNKKVMSQPNRKETKLKSNLKNKDKISLYSKKYRESNKVSIANKQKNYHKSNKSNRNKYLKDRYDKDPLFRLSKLIRGSITKSFTKNGYTKKSKTYKILGCEFNELKIHLELQFKEGMSWENHGEWHIDHKIPSSWAKNEEELIKLNHYTNLQPLWADENMSKKNFYSN